VQSRWEGSLGRDDDPMDYGSSVIIHQGVELALETGGGVGGHADGAPLLELLCRELNRVRGVDEGRDTERPSVTPAAGFGVG
jgi:hypothetical protein